ncbi:MAG TPA: regulatory protein RecX [Steroidobacteraceae bacterium]|nr:regulatory protein RecX [Steroidobacteraceae bacterium]
MGRPVEPLDARAARVAALDALARRDYAIEDLRLKLLEKGYDAAVVLPLLDALRDEKLLDDRRYLENFVAYHAARGQGPVRVRLGLRQHGIQGPLAEEYLDAYPDWLAQLKKARLKKFGAMPPKKYADRQLQARFLGYRGFTSAQIRMALGFDVDLDSDEET